MGMPMGPGHMGMVGGPMSYDSRRSGERGDRDESEYYDAQRSDARGSRGHAQPKHQRGERDGRGKERRQPYYSGNYNSQAGDGLSPGMSAMSLGSNLTQNLTQSSNGPLTQASSTLSQPMSQPDRVSLSALSQESYQGDDFYKSQSFVDPYM